MLRILIITAILLIEIPLWSQSKLTVTSSPEEVKTFVNQFVDTVQQYSIYSSSIDWTICRQEVNDLVKGIEKIEQADFILKHVLSKLWAAGDNHSFLLPKDKFTSYKQTEMKGTLEGKYLGNNLGYIKVGSFGSINDSLSRNFAQQIQHLIKEIDTGNKIKGWIVDLRDNGGGNMYPMICGLGPLIGEGTLGYFVSSKESTAWYYSKGKSGAGEGTAVTIKEPYETKKQNLKIAVLIGSRTASSGEATAISFIGRPNTKVFGNASAGYTTANSMVKLANGSALLLASSYEADRNKKQYLTRIYPDVEINSNDDSCLKTAMAWVLENQTKKNNR